MFWSWEQISPFSRVHKQVKPGLHYSSLGTFKSNIPPITTAQEPGTHSESFGTLHSSCVSYFLLQHPLREAHSFPAGLVPYSPVFLRGASVLGAGNIDAQVDASIPLLLQDRSHASLALPQNEREPNKGPQGNFPSSDLGVRVDIF